MQSVKDRRPAALPCLPLVLGAMSLGALLFAPMVTGTEADDRFAPKLTPKGIYHAVDELHRTGVKFFVALEERGKKPRRVGVNHPFATGDRFTFSFEINRDSYIYVINQTLRDASGVSEIKPAGLTGKRIERVYVEISSSAPEPKPLPLPPRSPYLSEPRLLFPTVKAGSNNRLKGDRPYQVPHRGYYVMDDQTGLERLYVVISDKRLDFSDDFHPVGGEVRGTVAADRLRRKLEAWKKNAEVEFVDKGIEHDVASYGVSIDPAKPAVVEIDLRHCR